MELIPLMLEGKGRHLVFTALQDMFLRFGPVIAGCYLSASLYQNGRFVHLSYFILNMLEIIKCDICTGKT